MRAVREQLQLGPDARVLVLISEGVTDPAHWQRVVADAMIKRRAASRSGAALLLFAALTVDHDLAAGPLHGLRAFRMPTIRC